MRVTFVRCICHERTRTLIKNEHIFQSLPLIQMLSRTISRSLVASRPIPVVRCSFRSRQHTVRTMAFLSDKNEQLCGQARWARRARTACTESGTLDGDVLVLRPQELRGDVGVSCQQGHRRSQAGEQGNAYVCALRGAVGADSSASMPRPASTTDILFSSLTMHTAGAELHAGHRRRVPG